MSGYALELRNAIKKATPLLKNIGDEASRQPPRPGKWCPREEPATLDYFMTDYVAHLKHHLNQIVTID
jgi:hypothetical protein